VSRWFSRFSSAISLQVAVSVEQAPSGVEPRVMF
jgi:hypothetical protein